MPPAQAVFPQPSCKKAASHHAIGAQARAVSPFVAWLTHSRVYSLTSYRCRAFQLTETAQCPSNSRDPIQPSSLVKMNVVPGVSVVGISSSTWLGVGVFKIFSSAWAPCGLGAEAQLRSCSACDSQVGDFCIALLVVSHDLEKSSILQTETLVVLWPLALGVLIGSLYYLVLGYGQLCIADGAPRASCVFFG